MTLSFDPERCLVLVRDRHDRLLVERALPWLTVTWLWSATEEADQA